MTTCHVQPIAVVRSPFQEKFTTPRQAGLTPSVRARIELLPDYASPETVRGLDQFSHIWLIFLFHRHLSQPWHPTVRPPRLGGNRRVGVFASRSPFRPNPIGLSAVKLLKTQFANGSVWLEVEGADLIDGTPIIDIKPYIPYADCLPHASGGFADQAPQPRLKVHFTPAAQQQLETFAAGSPGLENLIRETLSFDPRPAYRQQEEDERSYGCLLDRYNVLWQVAQDRLIVTRISVAAPDTNETSQR
jgi:tRNA-Thr(GGU) m(6)t(6)A37 methyltransferase TsaA